MDETIKTAFKMINEKYGKGSIFFGNEKDDESKVKHFASGSLSLDFASNVGGIPKGRLIEYFGYESSGKTFMTLINIAEAQKRGELCAFLDAEHAFDPKWASKVGVDCNKLAISQPSTVEETLGIVEFLARSGKFSLIVLDSLAALVTEKEMESDGDIGFPLKAKLLSQSFRKLVSILSDTNTTLICLNHLMEKIGPGYGDKKVTPGGRALKYYASVRVEFTRVGWIKDKDDKKIGMNTLIKFVKNKVASPWGEAEYDFIYGHGIDKESEVINLGKATNLLIKEGKHYNFENREFDKEKDLNILREKILERINVEKDKSSNNQREQIVEDIKEGDEQAKKKNKK